MSVEGMTTVFLTGYLIMVGVLYISYKIVQRKAKGK